jgi:hypothetical protein
MPVALIDKLSMMLPAVAMKPSRTTSDRNEQHYSNGANDNGAIICFPDVASRRLIHGLDDSMTAAGCESTVIGETDTGRAPKNRRVGQAPILPVMGSIATRTELPSSKPINNVPLWHLRHSNYSSSVMPLNAVVIVTRYYFFVPVNSQVLN